MLEECKGCFEEFEYGFDDFRDGWCYDCAEEAFNEKSGLLFVYYKKREFIEWRYDVETEILGSYDAIDILFDHFSKLIKEGDKGELEWLEDYCLNDMHEWISHLNCGDGGIEEIWESI